ncbi:oligopeptide transport system substrate-binding protein [Carnobacterium iners]|uniref:Oligopeptide transport system substrate-binding protein n=1 Tax=Carnobacterium iners TaxID=1073423 RepID=A0A1X7N090_9LACT|nr:peptide ABC transporter substrate-binding protein [Carnobacterium iners]SEK19889.1 oligopeptide transport system substrate-binding protein [Carnobacterium iners]SMH30128.1 oligopeptide transport system substrate-binding protein [Carnobacterium iners]
MTKNKETSLVILAALTVVIGGCATNTDKEKTNNNKEENQILNIAADSEMDTMDTTISTTNFTAMNNVFDGLLSYDLSGEIVPADAKNMPEISEDGLTYTFNIREDANWSNGTPVTAADYQFAWQRMVDPANGSGYAYLFSGIIKNAEAILASEKTVDELGIEAVGDKRVKVTLEQPVPYFINLLTIPPYFPQNEAYVTEQSENYGLSAETTIYNGPFVLSDWTAAEGNSWKYVKNDGYWDKDTVKLDEVNAQVVKEVGTGINLYDSGQLDIFSLSGNFVPQYKNNEDFKTKDKAWIYYLELNQEIPELANKNIRKAMMTAIDRKTFTENVLQDGSEPMYGHVPRGLAKNPETNVDFREEAGDIASFNIEEAQKAWEEGLRELDKKEITLELTTSDTEDSKKLAEFIQSEYQKNLPGLTIEIRQMPDNSRLDNVKKGDYQMATTYWSADLADPINFVERFGTEINRGNYSFEDVDQLIEKSNQQYNDLSARWESMIQAEKVALGEHYVDIPIYQTAEPYLEQPYVKDIYLPVFGSTSYKYAYIDKAQ